MNAPTAYRRLRIESGAPGRRRRRESNGACRQSINRARGSGVRSVAIGYRAIDCGDSGIVVAGGQKSMSLSPHCVVLGNAVKMDPLEYPEPKEMVAPPIG